MITTTTTTTWCAGCRERALVTVMPEIHRRLQRTILQRMEDEGEEELEEGSANIKFGESSDERCRKGAFVGGRIHCRRPWR